MPTTTLEEFACQVTDVAYDPSKAQNKEYVRVRVKFVKPLRQSKVVNLSSGKVVPILYDYERVQKR